MHGKLYQMALCSVSLVSVRCHCD